jgi:hypothetical protein
MPTVTYITLKSCSFSATCAFTIVSYLARCPKAVLEIDNDSEPLSQKAAVALTWIPRNPVSQ